MNINIGENIKSLRKRKDITQEELADHLGISFQSVSKWERSDGFPDITMLPDLADFFNVSVDELLGADRISGRDFFNICSQANIYELNGEYDKAVELLRDTLRKYPDHYDMTAKLASILLFLDNNSEEGKKLQKKAITLCERKLDSNISEKARATAKAALCFLYDAIGERQKAKDLASKLPHIWESREILYGELLGGEEYIDYLNRVLHIIMSIISKKIDGIADSSKKLNIIDMFFFGPTDFIHSGNRHEIMNKIIDFVE